MVTFSFVSLIAKSHKKACLSTKTIILCLIVYRPINWLIRVYKDNYFRFMKTKYKRSKIKYSLLAYHLLLSCIILVLSLFYYLPQWSQSHQRQRLKVDLLSLTDLGFHILGQSFQAIPHIIDLLHGHLLKHWDKIRQCHIILLASPCRYGNTIPGLKLEVGGNVINNNWLRQVSIDQRQVLDTDKVLKPGVLSIQPKGNTLFLVYSI